MRQQAYRIARFRYVVVMDDDQTLFEARLHEHRSLGVAGARLVAGILVVVGAVTAVGFAALGAWPVVGFAGVEVALAVVLLLRHRSRVGTENVRLTPSALTIESVAPDGRRRTSSLRPDWLRVRLVERAGSVPQLVVGERGRSVEIGTVLNGPERRALADELDVALDRMRSPWWDGRRAP